MQDELLKYLDVDIALIAAGFFGGIATLYSTTKVTVKVFLTAVSGGALLAGFLTPFASEILNLSGGIESGVAFLIGVFGMNIIGGMFGLSQKFRKDPIDTVSAIKKVAEKSE